MIRLSSILIVALFTFSFMVDRSPYEQLQGALEYYEEADKYSMTYSISSVCQEGQSWQNKVLVSGHMAKNGQAYLMRQGNSVVVMDADLKLIISQDQKAIVVDKSTKPDFSAFSRGLEFDSTLFSATYSSTNQGGALLEFKSHAKDPEVVSSSQIVLDRTGRITKSTVQLNQGLQPDDVTKCKSITTQISYAENPRFSSQMNTSYYLKRINDNQFTPTSKFSEYKVILSPNLLNR